MAPRPAMARTPPLSKPDVPVLRSAPLAVTHGSLYVAPGLPLGQRHALVVLPLAASHAQLQLDAPLLVVQLQGNQRHAGFPRPPGQVPDLATVQQELPRPGRLVVVAITLVVGSDVRVVQPRLEVWTGTFLWTAPVVFASASVAVGIKAAFGCMHAWSLLLLAPLYIVYY